MYTRKGNNEQVPSCVLVKREGEVFESFGVAAENKYKHMTTGERANWYYFHNFKMSLYGEKVIDEQFKLEDVNGNQIMALKVFTFCIVELKRDLLDSLGKGSLEAVKDDDIRWVLTVPAIWNDSAKRFMRKAAVTAGITSEHLVISLEPEAASIYCRKRLVENHLQTGSSYLVLDAGGGTVDIAVHRISSETDIEEIHQASGGPWGGNAVNKKFEHFLNSVFGEDVIVKLKEESIEDFIDLINDFETKKKLTSNEDLQYTIRIPMLLQNIDIVCTEGVYINGDKLRLDNKKVRELFEESITKICSHLERIFETDSVKNCQVLMMVGGFSDCEFLEKEVRARFPKLRVIKPENAYLAIVKGAVLFGNNPVIITQRICKYTYGEGIIHLKTEHCIHPYTVTVTNEHGTFCSNIFAVHATKGRPIKLGEKSRGVTGRPFENNDHVIVMLFASPREYPRLVTEEDCMCIGQFRVPVTGGDSSDINVQFLFGGTEIEVIAEDINTHQQTRHSVEYL